jgi:AbrB family looped-hinge helix DNA binding protein
MSEARMTSKGQITLPKDIRDRLGLKQGDRVRFIVEDDGRVRLLPAKRDVGELFGSLPKPRRALSIEEMDDIVQTAVARHVLGHDRD